MQANGQHHTSPFINSPALPGAIPQPSPDNEYPPQWNFGSLALPSRTFTPALSAGRSTPQDEVTMTREQFDQLIQLIMSARTGTPSDGSPAPSPSSPAETQLSLSRPGTPDVPKSKRIPRPPNAFMLYRSHLLRTRQIPPSVEHRQQNISRVAGQSWNMLPVEEKQKWHDKAKEVLTAHMAKYPDYKFSPERKASRRKTSQDPDTPARDSEAWVRHLRETYLHLRGVAPVPVRDRGRSRKNRSLRGVGTDGPSSLSLPPSLQPSPVSTPGSAPNFSAPPSVSSSPAMRSFTPQLPVDFASWGQQFGIPSFPNVPPPQEVLDQLALRTGQAGPTDDDVTPKAATFGDIALPTQEKFDFAPTFSYSVADSHLGLHNLALPGSFTGEPAQGPTRPATPQTTTYDSMWDNLICDPYRTGSGAEASGSALHEDASESPFALGEASGPIDFSTVHFPSLFPGSD